jgi:hypothetical protein
MAVEIGFLVGSLLLLAAVLYVTRVRNTAVPQMKAVDEDVDGRESETREPETREPETRTCDVCGSDGVARTTGDLAVCRECNDDLLS